MNVSAVLLAGGRSQRMGRADKGLMMLGEHPLAAHVLRLLRANAREVMISVNSSDPRWLDFGHPLLVDLMPGHPGPLAGLHAAMQQARHPLLLSAPCDTPFLPHSLPAALLCALEQANADIAIACTQTGSHPLCSLSKSSLLPDLEAYLLDGGRKVSAWHAQQKTVNVMFPDEQAFSNINTPDELAFAASILHSRSA